MDILIRTRFDNVERAEACIKRIREAECPVVEIKLIAPRNNNEDDSFFAFAPAINSQYPNTMGVGTAAFVMRADAGGATGEGVQDDDIHNHDAVVEIVAPEESKDKVRSIIINAGGRDTAVF